MTCCRTFSIALTRREKIHHAFLAAVVLSSVLIMASGCRKNNYGSGVRHPPTPAIPSPIVRITEIYLAVMQDDPNATPAFVELTNVRDETLTLAHWQLCSTAACVDLSGTIAPAQRLTINDPDAMAALHLSPHAGELTVVDTSTSPRTMLAYVTYGASPGTLGSSLILEALSANVITPGGFIPIPFPMPAGVAIANERTDAGCAAPSANAIASIDASLCPAPAHTTTPPIFLSELAFEDPALVQTGNSGVSSLDSGTTETAGASWVELANNTDHAVALHGVRLCIDTRCTGLPATSLIPAHGWVVIYLDRNAPVPPSEYTWFLPHALALPAVGEISLLAPGSDSRFDSDHILSYVRYGTDAPADNQAIAVHATRWSSVDGTATATTPTDPPLHTLSAIGSTPPNSPEGWQIGVPTPIAANVIPEQTPAQ